MWAHSGYTGRGDVLMPEGFEMDSEVVLGTWDAIFESDSEPEEFLELGLTFEVT